MQMWLSFSPMFELGLVSIHLHPLVWEMCICKQTSETNISPNSNSSETPSRTEFFRPHMRFSPFWGFSSPTKRFIFDIMNLNTWSSASSLRILLVRICAKKEFKSCYLLVNRPLKNKLLPRQQLKSFKLNIILFRQESFLSGKCAIYKIWTGYLEISCADDTQH